MKHLAPMPDLRFVNEGIATTSHLVYHEAAGTFWTWAWPELLGWASDIIWLFSPVTGNSLWPGDLWGVDEQGELILVETKRIQADRPTSDPYEDFVGFEKRLTFPDANQLNERWKDLYQSELAFVSQHQADLEAGNRSMEMWPGVVDHSRQRLVVWRWRRLYLDVIVPLLTSGEYARRVELHMKRRELAGSAPPYYFALFTCLDETEPRLSRRGRDNYDQLVALAGKQRVRARSVRAELVNGNQVRIDSLPANLDAR